MIYPRIETHPLLLEYKTQVCDQADEIDPDNSRDWHSMALGFFLGKGLSLEEANAHAHAVTYLYHDFVDAT